jgi:hypothetical protein
MKHITLFALFLVASPALADDLSTAASARPALRLSVEADPLDFAAYKGWSLFSLIQPEAFGPWALRFGTGVAYLPKMFTEGNGNKGWSFGFDPVTTVGVERFFREKRGGLFVLGALGYARMVFTGPMDGKVSLTQANVQVSGGYRWYPSDKLGLVVSAEIGAIWSFYRSNDPVIDGQKYNTPPISPLGEVLVGWDFDLGQGRAR